MSGIDSRSLAERLRARISRSGPLTFRDWMESALYDEREGYYRRSDRQRWGREGDYRTSPERSPLFAATFGRYCAELYETLGRPSRWTIVEIGAGAGEFAEGLMTTLQLRFPEVFAATSYVIDEVSESSTAAVKERLARFGLQVDCRRLTEMPIIPAGLVFSNELLDAFPVHRVTVSDGRLKELYVDVSAAGDFRWAVGPLSTLRISEYLAFVGVRLNEGQTAEINPGVAAWLTNIATRLVDGYVVTVDYGADAAVLYDSGAHREGTLRAFRRHQFVDEVLAHPGEQDLTTTVDWTFVRKLGDLLGLETVAFERQDHFLLQAGLLEELEAMVAESKTKAEEIELRTSSREMILPDGLAASFQVLVQKRKPGQTAESTTLAVRTTGT